MPQLNDCRYDALIVQGFTGHTNDMLLAWAQANGATSNHLNDALLEMLLLNGATSNCLTDAWYESLGSLGITGARNDRELSFWCDGGGAFSAQTIIGWTDGVDCSGNGFYVVDYNKSITFVDHTGVSFYKNYVPMVFLSSADSLLAFTTRDLNENVQTKITARVKINSVLAASQFIFANDSGADFRILMDNTGAITMRLFDTVDVLHSQTLTLGKESTVEVTWGPDGSGGIDYLVKINGVNEGGNIASPISVGYFVSNGNTPATAGLDGYVREIHYYENDIETNYWKIDDNDFNLIDSVGSDDGFLIQGTGTWASDQEEVISGPFTTSETSPTTRFTHNNVVWALPVIAKDVIRYTYNALTGNYIDRNSFLEVVKDNFNDTPGVALSAHTPDFDLTGAGWSSTAGLIIAPDGVSVTGNPSFLEFANITAPGVIAKIETELDTITIPFPADNKWSILIRRLVDGVDADELRCEVFFDTNDITQIRFINRVAGAVTALTYTVLTQSLLTGPLKFEITDDGNLITFTCKNTKQFITIDNAGLNANGGGNLLPTPYAGIGTAIGDDGFMVYKNFEAYIYNPVGDQDLILNNCKDPAQGYIAPEAQLLFKAQESGRPMFDSINGITYDASVQNDFNGDTIPNNDDVMDFGRVNGVYVQNDSSTMSVLVDWSPIAFTTDRVFVLAACIKSEANSVTGNTQPRVSIGSTNRSRNLVSTSFGGGLHSHFAVTDAAGNGVQRVQSPIESTKTLPVGTIGVLYVVYDPIAGFMISKFLNLDGTVALSENGSTLLEQSTFISGITHLNYQSRINEDLVCRLSNATYYAIGAGDYATSIINLDAKLAQWGTDAFNGDKGWPDL